jgi:hypothetical protein
MPRLCRMRGSQLVDSWSSRPGEPLAGLPKCFEGAGQKEVSCAGLRGPARTARAAHGGVCRMSLVRQTPPREARSLLYENRCPAMDSCGVMGMFWGLSAGVHVPCVRNSSMSGGEVRPAATAMAASTWLGMCLRVSQGAVILS